MFTKKSLQHHDYAKSLVDLPPWISVVPTPDLSQPEVNNNTPSTLVNSIVYQDELPLVVLKNQTLMYLTPDCLQMEAEINSQLENNIVRIDVSMLQAPKPFGSNYVNCIQRSEIWHAIRKNKITGSRLPALLITYGKPKYEHYWKVVKDSVPEEDLSHVTNIQRGVTYEDQAILYFERMTGSKTEKGGFFIHPTNVSFGASPDAMCAAGIILEVKTRALNSDGPLESLDKFPGYFLQCQLQMACTNAHSCVLLSYHPETKSGNFFLISRNGQFMTVVMEVVSKILNNTVIDEWHHMEPTKLIKIGEALLHKPIKTLYFFIQDHRGSGWNHAHRLQPPEDLHHGDGGDGKAL